ncbi:hypothetical protein GSI_01900 [Ganoderma sinense ZZ0214-1]|uniref:Uncharacterized protein n=1 Tax=Ganoderma sinense ZZ0214-1 TaxID=1077348 RepID=A0A2G8SRN8_9APHY|nr:hypothetical protein GSI_01900 [Ganoderma sinense ZZ0214-1]
MRNKSPASQRSNRLPLEIWQHIFLLACTDGGCTGYALTLVSKFFHDASQLIRFHSLAFSSLRQIEGFLAFAERATTAQAKKPKVHHLLLSFSRYPSHETSPDFGRADDIYGANAPVPDAWFRARQAREQEKAAWDKRFLVVLSALFDLVEPHLETLALLQSDAFALPPLRYRLPRLRELTLLVGITVILNEDEDLPGANFSGSAASASASNAPSSRDRSQAHVHPFTSPSASARVPSASSSPPASSFGFEGPPLGATPATRSLGHASGSEVDGEHGARARFPALERLHIICGRHRDWTLRDALAHLPRLAPSLACLRISNATYTHGSHGCVAAFLRHALDVQEGADLAVAGERDAGLQQPTMPQLRRVAVHSIPPPVDSKCGASQKEYRELVDAMEELLIACEPAPEVRFQWTESERARHQVWEEACLEQWVERIDGRLGI